MSSMVLDGVAARSRSTDPTTSVGAGRSANLARSQDCVTDILETFGPMADHELVNLQQQGLWGQTPWGKFSAQRLRSARAELVELGRVEFSGLYDVTDSGRKARVWQVVPD